MNRQDFILTLEKALAFLPENERRDILSDYEEHFRNELSSGKNEYQVASDLGNPVDIAEQYRIEKEELAAEAAAAPQKAEPAPRESAQAPPQAAPRPAPRPLVPPVPPVQPVRRAVPPDYRTALRGPRPVPPVPPVPQPSHVPPDYRTVPSAQYRQPAAPANAASVNATAGGPPPDPFEVAYPPAQEIFPPVAPPPPVQQPAAPKKRKTVLGVIGKILGVIFYTVLMVFVGAMLLVLVAGGYLASAALIGGGIYGGFMSFVILNGAGLIAGGFLLGIGCALVGAALLTVMIKCTGKLCRFGLNILKHDAKKLKEVVS